MSYDIVFTINLIGKSGVGKQTLRNRFGFELDPEEKEKITGIPRQVNIYGKDVELNAAEICRLHVREIEMDKKSQSLLPTLMEKVDGIVFLFDITNIKTLDNIDDWMKQIHEITPDIPIILIGNKSDSQKRALGRLDSIEYAHDRFCKAYIEISAKTGRKVEIAFHMISQILKDYSQKKIKPKIDEL